MKILKLIIEKNAEFWFALILSVWTLLYLVIDKILPLVNYQYYVEGFIIIAFLFGVTLFLGIVIYKRKEFNAS